MHYAQCDYLLGYVGPKEVLHRVLCTDPSDHDLIVVSQIAIISNNSGIRLKTNMIVK